MKLSELKKQIKDNIYEILSEVDDTATEKAANTAAINAEKLKIKASQEKLVNLQKGVTESEDEDREPTKAELEKEKIKGAPSKFKISQEQYEKLKKTLKTVVDKVKELDKKIKDPNTKQSELKDLKDQKTRKMESLKQFIKKPELVKAFKERDVKIDTGDLVG
jgi:vancomycin resistance protein YoaR